MSEQRDATAPLAIEGLTFRYRARSEPALHEVALTLARGELLLVAGSSGCGKTTLIRCINGLIPRSYKGELRGRLLLNGQDTSGMPLSRISQIVGTVLQDPERQILGAHVSGPGQAVGAGSATAPGRRLKPTSAEGSSHTRLSSTKPPRDRPRPRGGAYVHSTPYVTCRVPGVVQAHPFDPSARRGLADPRFLAGRCAVMDRPGSVDQRPHLHPRHQPRRRLRRRPHPQAGPSGRRGLADRCPFSRVPRPGARGGRTP